MPTCRTSRMQHAHMNDALVAVGSGAWPIRARIPDPVGA